MNNLSEREELFKKEVEKFTEYDQETQTKFYDYWSESSKEGKKMRWEMEKTFDIKRRIRRFSDNIKKWENASSKNKSRTGKVTGEQLNQAFTDFYLSKKSTGNK